ncbi:hypothetical protein [Pseudoalteromonas sp. McH1-42]|uniref:hypothetical protein n=1 Tax=Pseudoalteromonas sp. McH1-42 TaxID=2917752 RepID=UPI001EF61747|nr:hypothetical protein [Pseudoalteromonas sp. McH1-42]MCG7560858.1 hypothetical protein [Pseudoalteromonas sp. McH1-42]
MSKMTNQIVNIVASGGGVIVDAEGKMADQLIKIAAASVNSGAKVIIKNADSKMTDQLVKIAAAGRGNVIFDLS